MVHLPSVVVRTARPRSSSAAECGKRSKLDCSVRPASAGLSGKSGWRGEPPQPIAIAAEDKAIPTKRRNGYGRMGILPLRGEAPGDDEVRRDDGVSDRELRRLLPVVLQRGARDPRLH